MIVGSSAAWADEVTFTAGTDTGETSVTKADITVTMSTMSRTDNYRTYANTDMTVSSINGKTITKIELTCTASGTANYGPGKFSGTGYTYSGTIGTWTGSADKVTLNASSQVRITKIVVTYTSSASNLQASDFALTDVSETLSFDLKDSGSKTIHYSTSSTGNISFNIPDECVETIVDTDAKTITVTPKKETGGEVTITVIQSADNNYLQGSASFKVKIIDSSILLETIVFANLGYQNQDDVVDVNGVYATLKFAQGSNVQNSPTYYTTGSGARMYNGNTLTVTATKTIESIEFTFDGSYTTLALASGQSGTLSDAKNSVRTWTGEAKSIVFTTTATNRIKSIKLTYRDDAADTRIETSVEIDATGITNTNVFDGTAAGKLTASVKAADGGPIDGATVTWTSSDETVATIATDGTVTLVAAGTTTITANYAGVENQYRPSSATYELTVTNSDPNAPGTENNPYTVAQARAAIDAGTGVTGVYATGIVSEIVTAYNSQYGNITYNISVDGTTTADQLQAYRGKSYNGDNFTSADNIQVGDVVVIYGNLKKYNSTYEFEQDNQLVSLDRPVVTTPTLDVSPANVTVPYTGGSGDFTVTANNVNNAIGAYVTFYDPTDTETSTDEPSWIFISYDYENLSLSYTITDENQTGADRTACFKYYIMCDGGGAWSNLITVTQEAFVAPPSEYAELPFAYDGTGQGDLPDGLTQDGVGAYTSGSPSLKFDGTGDYMLLHFNERPGKLTFDIKGNGFSGGTFTVQTSEDGITYTDLQAYTELGATQSEEFDNLDENVRYIKWIYTEKSTGNVALGNIALAKYSEPVVVPSVTVSETEINVDAAEHEGTITVTYANISDINADVVFCDATGAAAPAEPTWITAEINNENNIYYVISANTGEARTAYLKVYALDDDANDVYSELITITQAAYVAPDPTIDPAVAGVGAFVKVTSTADITAGNYLIVYEDENVAFDGSLETLDAVNDVIDVTIKDSKIPATAATVAATFTIKPNSGTIQSASGYYIGVSSNNNGLKQSDDADTYSNTLSINDAGNVDIYANYSGSTMHLCFNADSNQKRFRYYKNASQKAIQLYKYNAEDNTTFTADIAVTDAGYATYCSHEALDFTNVEGLTAYRATVTVTDTESKVDFQPVTKVPAGEGVLLKGEAKTYSIPVIASAEAIENDFIGVLKETEIAETGIFVLLDGSNGVGFYKTKSAFTVGAHTAYLPATAGTGAREFIAIDDNTTTGVNSIDNGQLTIDNVYNLNGQRVNNAKKGLYIVNGKKVVIK